MKSLLQKFEQTLIADALIRPRDKLLVACSGGPDSVACFHLLASLRERWKLTLGLIHLHHGLRGRKATADLTFVKDLGRQFRLPVYSARVKVARHARRENFSIEEAARDLRYQFLVETAAKHGFRKVALAHTLDDQAETVLMRLIQGTGTRGLEGIRPQLVFGRVKLIRPLLAFTKRDLLTFLSRHRHPCCKDESNDSQRFLRNRIRKDLLPRIARNYNPRIKEALARVPDIVREENEILATLEKEAWKACYLRRRGKRILLDRKKFQSQPGPVQFRVLNQALQILDPKSGLSFAAWKLLRPRFTQPVTRHSLKRDIDIDLTSSQVICYKKKPRS